MVGWDSRDYFTISVTGQPVVSESLMLDAEVGSPALIKGRDSCFVSVCLLSASCICIAALLPLLTSGSSQYSLGI